MATAYVKSPWAFIRDEKKVPSDSKHPIECRDSEPPEFTAGMVENTVEVASEPCLYESEDGEPATLGEKLDTVLTCVSDSDTLHEPSIGIGTHSLYSTKVEMCPSSEIETDRLDPTEKVHVANPAAVQTNSRIETPMITESLATVGFVQSGPHLKVGIAGTEEARTKVDLERKDDSESGMVESDLGLGRFNDSPHSKDCSPTHLLITTPPESEVVVCISPESPPTHPTPKEAAGHEFPDCLPETPSQSVVLTKKQRAMLNYRAQLLGAASTPPLPTPAPPNTAAVSVPPPSQSKAQLGRKDTYTLMSLNAVLCETPPLSAARFNKDPAAPMAEPMAKTPYQPTEDEEYNTTTMTPTKPAPMLPTSSLLATTPIMLTGLMLLVTLMLLTSMMLLACPVTSSGLSLVADIVMPVCQLTPPILTQLASTSPHTQPCHLPNFKDPPLPWFEGTTPRLHDYYRSPTLPLLVATLLYEKAVPPFPAPPLLPGVAPSTRSSFVNRTVDEVQSEHGSHHLVKALLCLDTGPH